MKLSNEQNETLDLAMSTWGMGTQKHVYWRTWRVNDIIRQKIAGQRFRMINR